ncbi:hypothetical protein IDH44_04915 [Paenibacillus sp. IB182496]|uniref:Endospore appendages core domain-containing protein n=1 Tax=Paenibacillus sabuli TaxID=2772509 RepID=A0A927BSB2_9BACL|nr:S-Ena type endospore appendage [Paenibacillus sabuli]MBD2844523.1 hypothetical protein [Paenibacillus sabuli]
MSCHTTMSARHEAHLSPVQCVQSDWTALPDAPGQGKSGILLYAANTLVYGSGMLACEPVAASGAAVRVSFRFREFLVMELMVRSGDSVAFTVVGIDSIRLETAAEHTMSGHFSFFPHYSSSQN